MANAHDIAHYILKKKWRNDCNEIAEVGVLLSGVGISLG